ncbi:glycosyltransferase [Aquipseudomonas alcaligenes]
MEFVQAEEKLGERFDAVIMLTRSSWKTEPRSNRFHYAYRFSKYLPVLFVQPWGAVGAALTVERTELDNVDVVQVSSCMSVDSVREFQDFLRARGIRKPLVWIYHAMDYTLLLDALHRNFKVYHATEDYFTETAAWSEGLAPIRDSIKRCAPQIDLLVGVTAGVIDAYRSHGGYNGPTFLAENGCDSVFFKELAQKYTPIRGPEHRPVAIFQGGINSRLDFTLLAQLCARMPDWDFWFCGAADSSVASWAQLLSYGNVHYFGALQPKTFGKLMCHATVGIIPYIQDQWIRNSLPLKAYEYVACGLPVVTVPIDALERESDFFNVASTPEQFERQLRSVELLRHDPNWLERREEAASRNSYDQRFAGVSAAIANAHDQMLLQPKRLNVVVLYDERWTHVGTIQEHIGSFESYSTHKIYFMPATGFWPLSTDSLERAVDFSLYDVLIVHYSVRISLPDYFSEGIARAVENSSCFKVLFIQDEYEHTETARRWMERLKFDIVYTCVPESQIEKIYPRYRFPGTKFLQTLTGYVPEHKGLNSFSRPLADRVVRIAYRGRMLPYVYGTLGFEKYRIGVDVRELSEKRGLNVDIEVDDSRRIYGDDWYRFLGGARSTLGTESGSNVFDFDGGVRRAIEQALTRNPKISFDKIHRQILAPHEGLVSMNQISPKIFEAIRLRTALVLFEGEYSGVVKPNVHFIPLKKDYSNIEDVFSKLEDIDYLTVLTDRAYKDVIESGKYSYRSFVEGVDRDINSHLLHGPRYKLFSVPAFACDSSGQLTSLLSSCPAAYTMLDTTLSMGAQREAVFSALPVSRGVDSDFLHIDTVHAIQEAPVDVQVALTAKRSITFRSLRVLWRILSPGIRSRIVSFGRRVLQQPEQRAGIKFRTVRVFWRVLPRSYRSRIIRLISG